MARHITRRWAKHLIGCQRKGREAFLRGEGKDACPYYVNQAYGTGGKNLTKQRREYWLHGWETACREESTT